MSSLLSSSEKANLANSFDDIFDTFKREIVVYKEPKKVISTINESQLFGYGPASNLGNYEYVPVSGVFFATIRYQDFQDQSYRTNISSAVLEGDVRIKVKKEARDFINNGKTESIEFDGKKFNLISSDSVKRFLDSEFFVYYLEVTK